MQETILNGIIEESEELSGLMQYVRGIPGVGISDIQKTSTVGKVDTYTIYLTDGSTKTFTVTNGADVEQTMGQSTTAVMSQKAVTDSFSVTNKKLDNVISLLKDTEYTLETGTSPAYSQTVEAGSQKYAELGMIGGRSVIYNQLAKDFGSPEWTLNSTTSYEDGVLTFSPSGQYNTVVSHPFKNKKSGHKYYIAVDYQCNMTGVSGIQFYAWGQNTYSPSVIIPSCETADVWYTARSITPSTVDVDDGYIGFQVNSYTAGAVWKFNNLRYVDLTKAFGSGNEPTVVTDSLIAFIDAYYNAHKGYNVSEVVICKCDKVVSKGKNLFGVAANVVEPYGVTISKIDDSSFHVAGTSSRTYWSPTPFSSFTLPAGQYTLSVSTTQSDDNYFFGLYTHDPRTLIRVMGSGTTIGFSFTLNEETEIDFSIKFSDALTYDDTVRVMIERGSTKTDYAVYKEPIEYPIPAEIQALDGYGWSAETAYNYVDFERKKFVKRVAKLSLAVNDMNNSEDFAGWKNKGIISVVGANINNFVNGLCMYGTELGINTANGNDILFIPKSKYGLTQTEWKTQHADEIIDFYIPYAVPIETDISEYLDDDNYIETEVGGTVTFHQQDDTRQPLPNTVTYMVKVSDAI